MPTRTVALRTVPAWVFDVVGLGVILVVTALRSHAAEDLGLYDETAYLANGLGIRSGVLPGFTSGATYSDLYYVLSHITSDPIQLYFVGRAAAAVLFVLGVWIAARMLSTPALAWVAAAVVAVMPAPLSWPGVSAPAAGLLIVSVALVFRRPGPASLGVAAGLIWISAGMRPELAWVAAVASAIAIASFIVAMRSRDGGRPRWPAIGGVAVGAVAVPLLLVVLHGDPFESNGREWAAFQQHFSLRHATPTLDAWLDSPTIVAAYFPGASSLADAVRANPSAFGTHVMANLLEAPAITTRDVMGVFTAGVPEPVVIAMLGSVLLGLVVSVGIDGRVALGRVKALVSRIVSRRYLEAWVVLGAIVVSGLLSVGVVYPRFHYLLFPVEAAVVLAVALQAHVGSQRLTAILPVLAAGVFFAAFAIQAARYISEEADSPPPLATTATHMAESGHQWRMLGNSRLLRIYVPNLTEVMDATPAPGETFVQLLDREDIDVVLSAARSEMEPWTSMPGFAEFLKDPEKYGFVPGATGAQVFLRSDVTG